MILKFKYVIFITECIGVEYETPAILSLKSEHSCEKMHKIVSAGYCSFSTETRQWVTEGFSESLGGIKSRKQDASLLNFYFKIF
jgi:hypothetical protein